jgi:hypothetical protein
LGQFVQRVTPQKLPKARHTGIIGELKQHTIVVGTVEECLVSILGIASHCPELPDYKGCAEFANPLLPKEDRTAIRQLDYDGDHHHEG